METIQACALVDVVLCQRLPGVDEESQKQPYASGGRMRRRRATGSEEMDPNGGSDPVECMVEEHEDDAEDELQQREKEPKKENGAESQLYRYEYEHVEPVGKQVVMAGRDGGESGDSMQVELSDETMEPGPVSECGREGEPVPLDAVSEQLRNLSPSTDVTAGCGDRLAVIEPVAALINLRDCPDIPESPPGGETEARTAEAESKVQRQRQQHQPAHINLLDTSRHSWHVDKETQINPTTDDLELSAIFTSNSEDAKLNPLEVCIEEIPKSTTKGDPVPERPEKHRNNKAPPIASRETRAFASAVLSPHRNRKP
uniref:Uncharacterized protein n=1 Tax=Anopheles atroparvus TaxID=41427 RepID=A0A182J695_ANOAO